MLELQKELSELRDKLAFDIGSYILKHNQDITSISDFKEIWNKKNNNDSNNLSH